MMSRFVISALEDQLPSRCETNPPSCAQLKVQDGQRGHEVWIVYSCFPRLIARGSQSCASVMSKEGLHALRSNLIAEAQIIARDDLVADSDRQITALICIDILPLGKLPRPCVGGDAARAAA